MKYTSENLCVCFLCFMLGYLFCQNMRGTEGWGGPGRRLLWGTEGVSGTENRLKSGPGDPDFLTGWTRWGKPSRRL